MAQEPEKDKPEDNILRLLPRRKQRADDDPMSSAETRLARELVESFGCDLAYVAEWKQWMLWLGNRWQPDKKNRARLMSLEICERAAEDEKDKALASGKTISAVESLARLNLNIAMGTDVWDRDRYKLNTPAGTIDLKTGKLGPHNPDDYITKLTAVAPGGDCPTWLAFLDRVSNGDRGLQDYLQRIAGYAQTGDTKEHAFFVLLGPGGNGKSVFLETLSAAMGDYAETAPIETFTASKSERHPTDIAGLRGARLVTAIETEKGRNWAEAKIKALTGGDRMKARFMRQDFFWFTPEFKLVIAGNHMPGLGSVDEAMRRRIHVIPFSVTIPPEERDLDLSFKLKAELGGILQWAIDGALAWQRGGLEPPHAVRHATGEYLSSQDTVMRWLEDCTIRNPNGYTSVNALFGSWKTWTEKEGEPTGSKRSFSESVKQRGFVQKTKNNQRSYLGLELAPSEEPQPHWSDR